MIVLSRTQHHWTAPPNGCSLCLQGQTILTTMAWAEPEGALKELETLQNYNVVYEGDQAKAFVQWAREHAEKLYPDVGQRGYLVPPIFVHKHSTRYDHTVGADVLQEYQKSSPKGEKAHSHVARSFWLLSPCLEEPLFIVSGLEYDNLLKWVRHHPHLAPPLPHAVENRGDIDIMLIHPRHGVAFIQVKAVGDNPESRTPTEIQKKIALGGKQLRKDDNILRWVLQDWSEEAKNCHVTHVVALPNLTRQEVTSFWPPPDLDPASEEAKYTKGVIFLCKDDLPSAEVPATPEADVDVTSLMTWWKDHVAGMADALTLPFMKDIVSRYVGMLSAVEVYAGNNLRREVRLTSDAIDVCGMMFRRILLNEHQLRILSTPCQRRYLSGPPGSGKTVLLVLHARHFLRHGGHVIVVNMYRGAPGRAIGHFIRDSVGRFRLPQWHEGRKGKAKGKAKRKKAEERTTLTEDPTPENCITPPNPRKNPGTPPTPRKNPGTPPTPRKNPGTPPTPRKNPTTTTTTNNNTPPLTSPPKAGFLLPSPHPQTSTTTTTTTRMVSPMKMKHHNDQTTNKLLNTPPSTCSRRCPGTPPRKKESSNSPARTPPSAKKAGEGCGGGGGGGSSSSATAYREAAQNTPPASRKRQDSEVDMSDRVHSVDVDIDPSSFDRLDFERQIRHCLPADVRADDVMFVVDEIYVKEYWSEVLEVLNAGFPGCAIWCAGLYSRNPPSFQQEDLMQVLRCPPLVQKVLHAVDWDVERRSRYRLETDSASGIYTPGLVPLSVRHQDHPQVSITECPQCASHLASLLRGLGLALPPPLHPPPASTPIPTPTTPTHIPTTKIPTTTTTTTTLPSPKEPAKSEASSDYQTSASGGDGGGDGGCSSQPSLSSSSPPPPPPPLHGSDDDVSVIYDGLSESGQHTTSLKSSPGIQPSDASSTVRVLGFEKRCPGVEPCEVFGQESGLGRCCPRQSVSCCAPRSTLEKPGQSSSRGSGQLTGPAGFCPGDGDVDGYGGGDGDAQSCRSAGFEAPPLSGSSRVSSGQTGCGETGGRVSGLEDAGSGSRQDRDPGQDTGDDPRGKDRDPVGEDPVGKDPDPVGKNPDPVGKDPDPVGKDPGPVGKYLDPNLGKDPERAGEDPGRPGSRSGVSDTRLGLESGVSDTRSGSGSGSGVSDTGSGSGGTAPLTCSDVVLLVTIPRALYEPDPRGFLDTTLQDFHAYMAYLHACPLVTTLRALGVPVQVVQTLPCWDLHHLQDGQVSAAWAYTYQGLENKVVIYLPGDSPWVPDPYPREIPAPGLCSSPREDPKVWRPVTSRCLTGSSGCHCEKGGKGLGVVREQLSGDVREVVPSQYEEKQVGDDDDEENVTHGRSGAEKLDRRCPGPSSSTSKTHQNVPEDPSSPSSRHTTEQASGQGLDFVTQGPGRTTPTGSRLGSRPEVTPSGEASGSRSSSEAGSLKMANYWWKEEDIQRYSNWDKSNLFVAGSRCLSQLIMFIP
ncbi:hypothetical protein ACOMHN_007415 [Nucella lapillus]